MGDMTDMFEMSDDEPDSHDKMFENFPNSGGGDANPAGINEEELPCSLASVVSQPSTQASGGLHFSTPADEASESVQIFSPKSKRIKLTKNEAKDILAELDSNVEAAEEIVNLLVGGNFKDLVHHEELREAEEIKKKVQMKLYKLSAMMKTRNFRRNPSKCLETTFIKRDEYELLLKEHLTFEDELGSELDEDSAPLEASEVSEESSPVITFTLHKPVNQAESKIKPLTELKDTKYRGERTNEDFMNFKSAGYMIQRHCAG